MQKIQWMQNILEDLFVKYSLVGIILRLVFLNILK